MRLVFPDRERATASLNSGELTFGASDECDVHFADAGWMPHHATLSVDPQRGLWLRLQPNAGTVHVNARPIRERAMLRLGDVVSLGTVRFCVTLDKDDVIVRDLPSSSSLPKDAAAHAAAARVVLRGVSGVFHGRTFSLGPGLLLGSAADADVRIEDAGLAPHHARFSLRHEQVILRAEADDNKLRVNGELIGNAVLHPGDQIAIEPHRFVIEAPGLPPRGGGSFAPRQRPITQTMPAISDLGDAPAGQTAVSAPQHRRTNLWWLLFAAVLIAGALAALLVYAPR